MRCPKCKRYNHDKAKFCTNCGVSLNFSNISIYSGKKKYILIALCLFIIIAAIVILYNPLKEGIKSKSLTSTVQLQQLSKPALKKKLEIPKQKRVVIPPASAVASIDKQVINRESLFNKALLLKGINPLESLALISSGICIPSTLSVNNTPNNLKTENITKIMLVLMSELSEKGYDNELMEILTPDVILHTGNIQILIDAAGIISKNYGYGGAIQFIESVQSDSNNTGTLSESELDRLIAQLYQQWMKQQLSDNNIDNAKSIYDFANSQFPFNPEIHIAGIEIALKQGNWEKAEQLVNEINYPNYLSDKIELLKNQIAELKGQAGKIVIKFIPGSKHIPVQAILNGKIKQNFLVDTGASFVTIPTSTVRALGIRINKNAPKMKVSTAGGVKTAREIILKSISLDSCSVNNIKVLVLDIPGQPNLGLMGLNFLHYFHMEIDNKKGILLLKPR